LQFVADFLILTSRGCAECTRACQSALELECVGPRPMYIIDCGTGPGRPVWTSRRSPVASLSYLPAGNTSQVTGPSGSVNGTDLNRYRVSLTQLDSTVACSGASCRLCFAFFPDWFSGQGGYGSPPTTRLLSSDAGLMSIDAMQTYPGLTVAATVLPNATLPLSFEITAAHQPDESFHCSDDLDCELNGICQQVRGRLFRIS
jgi:hypothetical protein